MDDIHEPLEQYREEFKASFRKNAEEAFDRMERLSGIDAAENRETCAGIDALRSRIGSHEGKLSWMKFLVVSMTLAGATLALFPLYQDEIRETFPRLATIESTVMCAAAMTAGAVLATLALTVVRKKVAAMKNELEDLNSQLRELLDKARSQMEPLNRLFSWDMPAKLIEKTVPAIHFDPYFNAARLSELENEFGYTGFLNRDASVIFAHSGDIKGNPFVIAEMKKFRMGTKIYTGYKTIYWTEYETDGQGRRHAVQRSETLSASVEKPCPEYGTETFLMYANEAAPNLTFTRKPDGLDGDSAFTKLRKRMKRRSLERFSRNLEDDSDYTMMANQDFEVMFDTRDRNDEVEYRLLFTPLAQSTMMKLMTDREVGYGDDFSIVKERKINIVLPEHLNRFDLDTAPRRFKGYSLDRVRENFIRTNEEYFRQVYFAFAPLLSIPLYQQTRTRREIYGEKLLNSSSFWEWESLANFEGEGAFAHPASVTDNILKASLAGDAPDGSRRIRVTAHGFSGTQCVDTRQVWGGDGRFHTVYIDWVRYDPISRSSDVSIREFPDKDQDVIRSDKYPTDRFRRRILIDMER